MFFFSPYDPESVLVGVPREFLGEALITDLPNNDFFGIMTKYTPKSERLFPEIKEKLMEVYKNADNLSMKDNTSLANIDDIEILRYLCILTIDVHKNQVLLLPWHELCVGIICFEIS